MIVVDIETSGLDFIKNGIWQIGAIDLETGEEFLEEGRIDDGDAVSEEALGVIGKTEEYLRDKNKQSQKELIDRFFKWVEPRKIKNFVCQCPQFDIGWLWARASRYGLKVPFHKRAFDLHTIAQIKFFEMHGRFSIETDHTLMSLNDIVKFCGIEHIRGDHNALEDAKLTAECFFRLVYGKNLLEEFKKFEIPNYLKNDNLQ